MAGFSTAPPFKKEKSMYDFRFHYFIKNGVILLQISHLGMDRLQVVELVRANDSISIEPTKEVLEDAQAIKFLHFHSMSFLKITYKIPTFGLFEIYIGATNKSVEVYNVHGSRVQNILFKDMEIYDGISNSSSN